MRTEIIVIGGGIAGCSTAYYLSKAGQRVMLLEKNPAVGLEASGRCACGVRQQGRKGALPLAMTSVRIWQTLGDELGCDLEYWQSGNLKVRYNQEDVDLLEQEAAWEQAQGLTEVRMVSGDECRELVPGLTKEALGGKYCPTDGIANPMRVPKAIADGAARSGAVIKTNTEVTGLLIQGSTVRGVSTKTGEIEAEVVINAAGPWAAKFNALAGCQTPIKPGMSQLMITERMPRMFNPFTGLVKGYVLQPKSGNIVIGIAGKPNEIFRKEVDYPDIAQRALDVISLIPWLRDVKMIRSMSGITEYTPDGEPYIGAVPDLSGYYTIAGFHGQGFCVGPAAGKALAELIAGDEPCVSLERFNPGRLRDMERVTQRFGQSATRGGV